MAKKKLTSLADQLLRDARHREPYTIGDNTVYLTELPIVDFQEVIAKHDDAGEDQEKQAEATAYCGWLGLCDENGDRVFETLEDFKGLGSRHVMAIGAKVANLTGEALKSIAPKQKRTGSRTAKKTVRKRKTTQQRKTARQRKS